MPWNLLCPPHPPQCWSAGGCPALTRGFQLLWEQSVVEWPLLVVLTTAVASQQGLFGSAEKLRPEGCPLGPQTSLSTEVAEGPGEMLERLSQAGQNPAVSIHVVKQKH